MGQSRASKNYIYSKIGKPKEKAMAGKMMHKIPNGKMMSDKEMKEMMKKHK